MRAIAFAMVLVGVHSFAMAKGPRNTEPSYDAEKDNYYSRIVGGISIHENSRDLPDGYKVRHAYVGSHVSILVKLESVDRSIFFDQKAARKLFNQISLWADEQLVMQGVMRPSLTVIRVNSRGGNTGLVAVRDGLSEPWWIEKSGWLTEQLNRHSDK
jgi:hypothetical protein